MNRLLLIVLLFFPSLVIHSQWRVGVTAGADYNIYSIDTRYLKDWHYEGAWGLMIGAVGQYDFNNWFGLRTEINMTTKNHNQYTTGKSQNSDYKTWNFYAQLPVMASFSIKYGKIEFLLNLGIFGSYWLSCLNHGVFYNDVANKKGWRYQPIKSFNDNRLEYGPVGGIGVGWGNHKKWSFQMEARCYYSIRNEQKNYMRRKDPRYNTTLGILATIYRHF